MDRTYLTVTEAAEALGVSRQYIYNRISEGSLPTLQLGTGGQSKYRISSRALDEFVAARTTGPRLA